MKKLLAIILILSMVACFSACGGGSGSGDGSQTATDVLYHSYGLQPYVTLDPRSENSNGVMVLNNVYETLTYYNDQTGEVEPLLATSWEEKDEGLTWVFQVRDDVTFHDGTPMTAQNVANSINATIEMGMGASYIWDAVESVEATGDYEVTFKLSYAAPIDIIASAAYAAFVVSDAALENDTEWFNEGNDGGTGPYMIAQATGDSVVLKAYDGYRGGWQDNQFKNVLIKETAESSARRQLLETGEAQITVDLAATDIKAMREETDLMTMLDTSTYTNTILFLNHDTEPCNNADFRRGLAYAFPYQETINDVIEGNAEEPSGLVTRGLWGHDDSIGCYETDLDKAKEYFDKSGIDYNGMTLSMTYSTGTGEYDSLCQLYQVNLKKLGIDLKLEPMEWDSQWDRAKATKPEDRQDIFLMQWWPDYADPVSWFTSLVHSEDEIYFNLSYIKDENYDALIDEAIANTVTDRDKAEQNYIEIQKQIFENADLIPIYDLIHIFAVSNSVSGVYENPAYNTCVRYYNVTKN